MTAQLDLLLCHASGARAGCGPCVLAAGHDPERDHQDAEGQRFEVISRCPYCASVAREGAELAAHVAGVHGGAR